MSKILRYFLTIMCVCLFSATITLAADQAKKQDQKRDQKKDGSCRELIIKQDIGFDLAADQDRTRDQKKDQKRDRKKDGSCKS